MWRPHLRGEIERRLLVNYRVDPDVAVRILPAPFRPQLVDGYAVAGICLIRLGGMRPTGIPRWAGLRSENAAHRMAVEWGDPSTPESGVYIPRRDSNSRINTALGGRIYPGEHHHARFAVAETAEEIQVAYSADDGSGRVDVKVRLAQQLPESVLFDSLEEASGFFERGSIGYSATPSLHALRRAPVAQRRLGGRTGRHPRRTLAASSRTSSTSLLGRSHWTVPWS